MRICFISLKSYPLFNPKIKSTFGGAETQMYLLSKELGKNSKYDNHFVVADYGQEKKEHINNIDVWKSFSLKDNILKKIIIFYKVIKTINAEIYVQTTLSLFSGFLAVIITKLFRKKFIYLIANDRELDGSHKLYKNPILRFFTMWVFKYSTLLLSQNSYQTQYLESLNIPSKRLNYGQVIKTKIPKKHRNILWVGRSTPVKRPNLYLKLARALPDYKFTIICPPSTFEPEFSKQIKSDSKKISNVEFIKFVPFNKIDEYFEKAKVFVNTSTVEGFPDTFLFALNNRAPIISLKVNPNSFISKHKCGFVCKDNFNLMKDKLSELLENKKLYDTLSKNSRDYMKKNHDIKIIARKFNSMASNL